MFKPAAFVAMGFHQRVKSAKLKLSVRKTLSNFMGIIESKAINTSGGRETYGNPNLITCLSHGNVGSIISF